MTSSQPFTRHDTILGVCEAIGEDFGIQPIYLRVALCGLLFWNPWAVTAAYVAAGLAIAILRWLVPNSQPSAAT